MLSNDVRNSKCFPRSRIYVENVRFTQFPQPILTRNTRVMCQKSTHLQYLIRFSNSKLIFISNDLMLILMNNWAEGKLTFIALIQLFNLWFSVLFFESFHSYGWNWDFIVVFAVELQSNCFFFIFFWNQRPRKLEFWWTYWRINWFNQLKFMTNSERMKFMINSK